MIKIGIIGGAGYTAGELIRLLLNHPDAEITFVNSTSNAGNLITDVHGGLFGETDMRFTEQLPLDSIDLLFFCTAHGLSLIHIYTQTNSTCYTYPPTLSCAELPVFRQPISCRACAFP